MKRTLQFNLYRIIFPIALAAITQHALADPLPNAWAVLDISDVSGSTYTYSRVLDNTQRVAATNSTGGFRLSLDARMRIEGAAGTQSMLLVYGLGSSRFLIWLNLDGGNNLTAQVEGYGDVVVVDSGLGTAAYHTHEMVYDGTSGTAMYLFDGQVVVSNWTGSAIAYTAGEVAWGAGSSSGTGGMNVHAVEFAITNSVVFAYDAGTENNPATAPNPQTQGWVGVQGAGGGTVAVDVSPDAVLLPTATTLPVSNLSISGAQLNGEAQANGSPATAWFEWGTHTNYGTTTSPVDAGAGLGVNNLTTQLNSLVGGPDYHYRVVASNRYGLVLGTDETFNLGMFPAATPFPEVRNSSVAWADYDQDGWMDLLLTGWTLSTPFSQLWRNTGGSFVQVSIPGLPGVYVSSVAWADYDNDGDADFLLTGWNGSPISQLWRNTGGDFEQVPLPGLPGVYSGSVAWADYDNDGYTDFLLTGRNGSSAISQLWRNTGSGFEQVPIPGLPGVYNSSVAWADYDNDGDADFLLTGYTGSFGISQLWRNTGAGFEQVSIPGLPGVSGSSVAWADYDNDGNTDFLLTGYDGSYGRSQLWRNTGSGFEQVTITGLPGVDRGSVAWADYDNDGDADFLLTGDTGGTRISQLWRNTGGGFEQVPLPGLPGVSASSVAWADYDNDGYNDFLLTGYNGDPGISQLWKNYNPTGNTLPTAPSTLSVVPNGYVTDFSWSGSMDAETPSAGLSYNVRIGTSPGGGDILSPLALADGTRLIPDVGNTEAGLESTLPMALGQTYYWSVQAVDGTFAGGPFSAEQSFTLNSVLTPADGIHIPGDLSGDGTVSLEELNAVLGNYNGGIVDQAALDDVLALYWPDSPWLNMTNVAALGTEQVTFALTNSTAGAYSVESSTNLVDWSYLGPAIPRYEFIDTNAPAAPQRFYRLMWP